MNEFYREFDMRNLYVGGCTMKVAILYDSGQYSDSQILDDLRSEEFRHEFKLLSEQDWATISLDFIDEADEVWVFGDIDYDTDGLAYALLSGKDIWKMG